MPRLQNHLRIHNVCLVLLIFRRFCLVHCGDPAPEQHVAIYSRLSTPFAIFSRRQSLSINQNPGTASSTGALRRVPKVDRDR